MAKAKNVGNTDPDAVVKKVLNENPTTKAKMSVKPHPDANRYEVQSQGYKESFSDKEAAMKQAEFLKKRAVKNQEPVKIAVKAFDQKTPKGALVHNVQIDDEFYNQ